MGKKRDGFINPGWLAGVIGGPNPTKNIIAETASNNPTNDLEQKKIYPKVPPASPWVCRTTVDDGFDCSYHSLTTYNQRYLYV